MAENQTDGAVADDGQGGEPSQPSSPQTPKPFDGDVTTLFSALEEKLSGRFTEIEKNLSDRLGRVQGTVDRSQNDFKQWLGKVEQYEKKGMTRDEAIAEIDSQNNSEQRWTGLEKQLKDLTSLVQSGGTQQNRGQAVTEVFASILGADALKDTRVAPHLVKQYGSKDEMELAAYRIQSQLAASPNPNAAQSASLPGGQGGASNLDALSAEYNALSVNPAVNFERMTQIQKELDAAIK